VIGSEGRLEITIPFNQPQDGPTIYLTHFGQTTHGLDAKEHVVTTNDQYTSQGEAFSLRVRNEAPTRAPLLDAMTNMRITDAVFQSASTRTFVDIAQG
jgi:predicted dehydrogenase